MKNFWKVLGVAALAVGLTPYKVEKDEETGENKYQALLWQAKREKKDGENEKGELNITLGFYSPFQQQEEAHLFSEDLSVEYAVPKAQEAAETVLDTVKETAEKAADAVEDAVENVAGAVEDAAGELKEKAEAAAEAASEAVEEAAENEAP